MTAEFEALDLNDEIYALEDFSMNLLLGNKSVLIELYQTNKLWKDFFPEIKFVQYTISTNRWIVLLE